MATPVFLLAAAFTLYTLFGYPLLLAFLARRRARPTIRQDQPRSVTVLLPVYNGERFLPGKLDSLLALDYPRQLVDILVLDDASTDGSAAVAASYASRGVRVLPLPRGGKAMALNAGLTHATGEILFLTDVRQTLSPNALRALNACFADPSVGAVSGELVILDGVTKAEANVGLYWKYEKWIRTQLSAIDSVPGCTGCIYAMRRSLAKPLPPGCLLDDVFLPLQAYFAGYRVLLEPEAKAFDYPTTLDSEFRRKVRTLAGNYQLIGYLPNLLGPANRMWIHFVSHKIARLLLPFSLLAALLAAPFLPSPWNWVCSLAQAGFYLLALADLAVPEKAALKRITSPARIFVVLMAASFRAAGILLRPNAEYWVPTVVRSAARPPS
jgi:biofilm PGA synthesis N-glycosyltransferase PgaC